MADKSTFSFSADVNVRFELGSYALSQEDINAGEDFVPMIRVRNVGEYVVPQSIIDEVDLSTDGSTLSPEQRALRIFGKMLEAANK